MTWKLSRHRDGPEIRAEFVADVSFWSLLAVLAIAAIGEPAGARSYLALGVLLLAPGMIMLGFPTRLYLPPLASIVLVMPLSVALGTITASYLNFTPFGFDGPTPIAAVLLLALALRWLASVVSPGVRTQVWQLEKTDGFLLLAAAALAAAAISLTIDDVLGVYLPEFDPWKDAIGVREILARELTPLDSFQSVGGYNHVYHGLYYLLAFAHSATGLDVYDVQRFDGSLALAVTVVFASLTARTVTKSSLGLIAGPLILANPFLVRRFITPYREDVALAMLMVLVFLLVSALASADRRQYFVPLAVAFSAIVQFHPLTLAITVLFLAIFVSATLLRAEPERDRFQLPLLIAGVVAAGAVLSAAPSYRVAASLYDSLETRTPVSEGLLLVGLVAAAVASAVAALALVALARRFRGFDAPFITGFIPAAVLCVLLAGLVDVAMHPLGKGGLLGVTNPRLTLSMFSPALLVLMPASLGLLAFRQQRDPALRLLGALAMAVLAVVNLPNLDIEYQAFRTVIYLAAIGGLLGGVYLGALGRSAGRLVIPALAVGTIAASMTSGALYAGTQEIWTSRDIAAVRAFESIRSQTNGPVYPHPPDGMLLDYMGMTGIATNGQTQSVFESETYPQLRQSILRQYPDAVTAYLFFSRSQPTPTWRTFDSGIRQRLPTWPQVERTRFGKVNVWSVPLAVVAPCPAGVPWNAAGRYVGQLATIRGPVTAVFEREGAAFLQLGRNDGLLVVIPALRRSDFPGTLEAPYLGKDVCVLGDVTRISGLPVVRIGKPQDIAVEGAGAPGR